MGQSYNPQAKGSGMGIGKMGIGESSVTFKRKFRWTFEIEGRGKCKFFVPAFFCQVTGRPQVTFEEVEVNFLNRRTWWPGKPSWEPITVTYFDAWGAKNTPLEIFKWLTGVYDFNGVVSKEFMTTKRIDYLGEAKLRMWDGCGNKMETWTLKDAWPQAINYGDCDMSSSDVASIEITIRYSSVNYEASCGANATSCECGSCSG